MKLFELAAKLKHLATESIDSQEEVEYIIATKTGRIITCDVGSTSKQMIKMLKVFKQNED
jgi:single-stranded DNA-specific DHH superfamily exonuclease